MELAAKYAYEVYEQRSFSRAAESLFISQPALSAMVAKLERELGFVLFERTRGSAVTLTPKGQIYMDMLKAVRIEEEIMKKRMEQYDRAPSERLSVGAMMHMAQFLIPEAVRRLHERYPDVLVDLNMGNVGPHGVLHDKLESGMLDVLLSYRAEARFESLPLFTERYIVMMRRDLAGTELQRYALPREQILARRYSEEQVLLDLSLLDAVPFITTAEASRIKLFDLLGPHFSLSSVSVTDSRNSEMHYRLVKEGLGAILTIDAALYDSLLADEDLMYIVPRLAKPYRTLYVLRRKGERLSEPARYMMELLGEQSCEKFGYQERIPASAE